MSRVLQVRDLLVHAVNDLEVCLLLRLIQTLQVGWLGLALGQQVLGAACIHGGLPGSLLAILGRLHVLRVLHGPHPASCSTFATHA